VTPTTCDHVETAVRPGLPTTVVSGWIGHTSGPPCALTRYDLHDCARPPGAPVLVCTFWPGASTAFMTDLVQRMDGAHLFGSARVTIPGRVPPSGWTDGRAQRSPNRHGGAGYPSCARVTVPPARSDRHRRTDRSGAHTARPFDRL